MTNAWIQRLLTIGLLLLSLAGLYSWHSMHPAMPLLVLGMPLAVIAAFEAIQFLLLHICNRNDPAPKATLAQYLAAYWSELTMSVKIFGIWQPFQHNAVPDRLLKDSQNRSGVILVHGFFCNRAFWNGWMRQLEREGRAFIAVDLQPAFGSIDAYADILEQAAQRMERLTGQPAVLVGHSMGGLAIRAWIRQRNSGLASRDTSSLVRHVITLGTPHQGTWFGRLSQAVNGRQMALSSAWLTILARQELEQAHVKYTCFYSNSDNIVFPVSSATLPLADNRVVTGLGHVAMVYDRQVQQTCWELMP